MNIPTSWKRTTAMLAVALGVALPWGTDADAHGRFRTLKGGLTTVQVECASLCTEGPLTGGLAGKLEFTMASMTPTHIPNVSTYKGVNTITTPHGTLSGPDDGIWNLATGEFVDYTTFTSGTGAYAGKHGSLVIIGVFDPVSGTGSSRYTAILVN
jgi:hypothetical protein